MNDAGGNPDHGAGVERGLFLIRNPSKNWLAHRIVAATACEPTDQRAPCHELSCRGWQALRVLIPTAVFGLVASLGPVSVVTENAAAASVGGLLTLAVLLSRAVAVGLGRRTSVAESSALFSEELVFWAQAALWAPTLVLVSMEHGLGYLALGLPIAFGTRVLVHRLARSVARG